MKLKRLLTFLFIIPIMGILSACSTHDLKSALMSKTKDITPSQITDMLKGDKGDAGTDGQNGLNGKNGKDGDSINLYEIFQKIVELEGYSGSFSDFVKEYLGTDEKVSATSKALRSSVSIYAGFSQDVGYLDMYGTINNFTCRYYGFGSGVFYSLDTENGDALVITNHHVVYNHSSNTKISDEINLLLYGNNNFSVKTKEYVIDYNSYSKYEYTEFESPYAIKATYLGGSMQYDIAVLKVEGENLLKNTDLLEADFADSNEIAVGETAIAVGNASSLGLSATTGCISVDSEYLTLVGADNSTPYTYRVIRTDSAVNPGNSGGGLFNLDGKLIGIVNAKTSSSSIDNIGYAIPSNLAKYVVQNIIKNCNGTTNTSVKKASLGFNIASISSSLVYNEATLKTNIIEKIAVVSLTNGGLAKESGLSVGDILTKVHIDFEDGREFELSLTRVFQIIDLSISLSVGDVVTISRTSAEGAPLEDVSLTITNDCITVCA